MFLSRKKTIIEALSCFDDVARAAVLYLKYYKYTRDKYSLTLAREVIDFVIYLEADDGQFYNFVFPYGTVNIVYFITY